MNTIVIEYKEKYAVLKLRRGRGNVINSEMANELIEAFQVLKEDNKVLGVLITGNEGFFSAGLDLVELYDFNENEIRDFWKLFVKLTKTVIEFDKPLVAAITGHSPAGGCVIALGCDYRIMAKGDYRIGLNEVQVGIIVPESIFKLYANAVGQSKAHQFLLEAKLHLPEEAYQNNLVDELQDMADVIPQAEKQLKKFMQFNQDVWKQSKRNLRKELVAQFDLDFDTIFNPILKQWWTSENRATLEYIISTFKK